VSIALQVDPAQIQVLDIPCNTFCASSCDSACTALQAPLNLKAPLRSTHISDLSHSFDDCHPNY
jgi:hypothetical protein